MTTSNDNTKCCSYPLSSLKIGGTDISKFKIAINENPTPSVQTAVAELQKYVRLAVGFELPCETFAGRDGHLIYLDDTAFDDDETYSLKNDGECFVIGGSGVRGVIYGVYEFLERCVGWRFLTPDCDYMAKSGDVDIVGVDIVKEQYFIYRDPYWYTTGTNFPNFSAKRKINYGTQNAPEYGGGLVDTGCHTFGKYIPESRDAQPCLCKEETYEKVLAGVLADLEAEPDRWCVSVSQNDNFGYCECEHCKEIIERDGYSGYVLAFVNRVAEAVEKKYPKVLIHTLAYSLTQSVPKDPTIKPRDNVLVQLCSVCCCFNRPLTDDNERNNDFRRDFVGWSALCDKLFIWDYCTNFKWYTMELGNLGYDVLAGNMRLFADSNAKGVRELGAYETQGYGSFQDLKAYLLSHLLQEPYMTKEEYETHTNEFLRGFYGKGWESIRAFLDFVDQKAWKMGLESLLFTDPDELMLKTFRDNMPTLEGYFDRAASLAESDAQRENIRRLRVQLNFFKINSLWDEMYTHGTDETKSEIVKMAFDWQSELQKYNISISEARGIPNFKEITRPPLEWRKCHGNSITEEIK